MDPVMKRTLLALALLSVLAVPASAHARLVKSNPSAGAKVSSPAHIILRFSEALEPAFSGALLLDKDGRNISGEPVKIDGPLMTLTPDHLAAGVYHVSWHSVGHDTHRLDGDFSFTVKP
jgi:methionine-rich copper-binding protein CopC